LYTVTVAVIFKSYGSEQIIYDPPHPTPTDVYKGSKAPKIVVYSLPPPKKKVIQI